MNNYKGIKFLILEGNPKERGLNHGKALKSMIKESLERTKYFLSNFFHESPKTLISNFIKNTNFISAVKKWTPSLLEEIEGITEGSDEDFNDIFFLQCGDEAGWFLQAKSKLPSDKCSGLGCFKEKNIPALVAQTLDWLNINEGLEVLFHVKYRNSSLECFLPSVPGVIGLCGLNNLSIGITTNALWSHLNSSVEGLPVNFIVRGILEQESFDKAIDFVKNIKHASAENYIIGNFEKVMDFECSANKICLFTPYSGARRVYHTNHPIVNDDFLTTPKNPDVLGTSPDRFEYLEFRLKDPSKKININTIKNILRSHFGPICVHHNFQSGIGYTQYAVIYSLKKSPELYLTIGPPCLSEFKRFKF